MRITAIVVTCDRPALLGRALASVAGQRRRPDEVIIVDDGVEAAQPEGWPVIRSGPLGGPSAARNRAARAATGDVLAFLDDDDEWDAGYLGVVEGQASFADVVLTAFMKVDRSGDRRPEKVPPPQLSATDWFVRNQGLRGSNLVIRREAFLALRGFDEVLGCCEDMDLAVRLADRGVSYRAVTTPLVTYHSHSGPRITSPGDAHRHAQRSFLAKHGGQMTEAQVLAFRERTQALFGVDPGPVPRLVWVLGPPGAGKTTWAEETAQKEGARVLGLSELLIWRDGASDGVGTAKRHLIAAIRAVELRRSGRRLFVTGAVLPPDALGLLSDQEHLIALVPERDQWEQQLRSRDGGVSQIARADYEGWASRFGVGAQAGRSAVERVR